ncbi:MAG: 30S ribosomal protein S10 [Promethearchaeota archaeon]
MVQKTKVRLLSANLNDLKKVISEIKDIVEKTGIKMYGPIPLPTKHLRITTRKSPCGEGTNTWEHYEMRIHKRLINLIAQERSMLMIMKIKIPESVIVEIEVA